jgi:gp32 DNA binding protein like
MDINTLRKMRNSDFGQISNAFEKIANPQSESKSYTDDRFWKLEGDKAGNGTATIRFLPRVEGDELPWVRIFSHGFQGPTGKWYIENSLTTLNEQDPVSELNTTLWNSGVEANKKIAQNQKRRLSYIANVLIVSDPKHPENEGKVMLFKFGKKIFDKIMDKARPTFEDEKPVNVFDFWEGANFKLRMRKKDGFTNYDESAFMEPSALGDDEKIVEVASKQYKLAEFLDRKNFKSYDELKRKLDEVLSGNGFNAKSAAELAEDEPEVRAAPEPAKSAPAFTPKASAKPAMDDEDDVMSYFEKIAAED